MWSILANVKSEHEHVKCEETPSECALSYALQVLQQYYYEDLLVLHANASWLLANQLSDDLACLVMLLRQELLLILLLSFQVLLIILTSILKLLLQHCFMCWCVGLTTFLQFIDVTLEHLMEYLGVFCSSHAWGSGVSLCSQQFLLHGF